jgi:diguanylate cyclase (GGDEF)-like protein/PAS domain S-box-containing protein
MSDEKAATSNAPEPSAGLEMSTEPDAPVTHDDPLSEECQLLLEHLRDIVLFVRMDGSIARMNRAAVDAYGYSQAELRDMDVVNLVAPGAPSLAEAIRSKHLQEGDGLLFETIHRRQDGTTFPVEVNARVAPVGGQSYVLSVIRDISERMNVEHQLERAYSELEQVFETAANGMRIIDTDYNMVRLNRTFARMAGVDVDEGLGRKCYEVFAGELCHTERCPLRRVLAGEGRLRIEVDKRTADGRTISTVLTAQPHIVSGKVVGVVEDFHDVTARKQAEETARHMATHDVLTSLPNRMLFGDRLDIAVANAARSEALFALLFCDLDDFKSVNDTFGHAAGDFVLREVARALSSAVRKGDTVARFGGDEFVLLLPNVSGIADAEGVTAKLIEEVGRPILQADTKIVVKLSVGVTLSRPGDDADALLRRADDAMYGVKSRGGGGFAVG